MMTTDLVDAAGQILNRVKAEHPLIHVMTNLVTMSDVANACLAIGARPIMAQDPEEVEEIAQAARALVLNLGTPSRERIKAMLIAGRSANAREIPITFDPVGVGASALRREAAAQILSSLRLAVIRGNAGEMGMLGGVTGGQSGVDARESQYDRAAVACSVAVARKSVAVITGAVDHVSDSRRLASVANGSPQLQRISGAGDILDALIGAALAVERDPLTAAVSGLVWLGAAAEHAAQFGGGIGTFRRGLFDSLDGLDPAMLSARAKITLTT